MYHIFANVIEERENVEQNFSVKFHDLFGLTHSPKHQRWLFKDLSVEFESRWNLFVNDSVKNDFSIVFSASLNFSFLYFSTFHLKLVCFMYIFFFFFVKIFASFLRILQTKVNSIKIYWKSIKIFTWKSRWDQTLHKIDLKIGSESALHGVNWTHLIKLSFFKIFFYPFPFWLHQNPFCILHCENNGNHIYESALIIFQKLNANFFYWNEYFKLLEINNVFMGAFAQNFVQWMYNERQKTVENLNMISR